MSPEETSQEKKSATVVLITGATSGIGFALARLFAQDKHNLFLVARSEPKLAEIKQSFEKEFGIRVCFAAGDLTERAFLSELPNMVKVSGCRVSCLVNNAGSGLQGNLDEIAWTKQEESILLNVLAPTYLIKAFEQDLASSRGSILNVVSMAAFFPGPHMAVYYASKAYLASLSESLSVELRSKGIRVTAIYPGPTRSGFQKANGLNELPEWRFPDASSVAASGYEAWKQGKTRTIVGSKNKFFYFLSKVVPQTILRWYAGVR